MSDGRIFTGGQAIEKGLVDELGGENEARKWLDQKKNISIQLGSRLIDGVAKKMADYFFGRFADLVSPETTKNARVEELKSNFLNKYIYPIIAIIILLIVVIFYFVSR